MFFLSFALLATACAPAEHTAEKLATDLKDNIYQTSYRIHKWASTPPAGKGAPQPVPQSYCYRTMQDILCYRQPMPGWEHRLVGWQGTGAEPPPAATMELLQTAKYDASVMPEARVARAQPVFVTPPPQIKDDKTADPAVLASDPTQEQLPNPMLTPQL